MQIPYLTYSDIKREAEAFLDQYRPTREIPIPIESIIDVHLGINIFPMPRLYKDYGQNGYLSQDRSTIYVDDVQYDNFYEKCRFTLAHELGHYILHPSFYDDLEYDSIEGYISWMLKADPDKIGWLDTHAQWFAGSVLIPCDPLREHCSRITEKYRGHFKGTNISIDEFLSYAANEIAKSFEVSPSALEAQIRKEQIARGLSF